MTPLQKFLVNVFHSTKKHVSDSSREAFCQDLEKAVLDQLVHIGVRELVDNNDSINKNFVITRSITKMSEELVKQGAVAIHESETAQEFEDRTQVDMAIYAIKAIYV